MNTNKPTRASQAKKSDTTKVVAQSKTVAPKARPKVWTPPSYLDTPNAPNGFRHRWVRAEILGYVDTKNIQGRLRTGYELVRADEYPEDDYPAVQRKHHGHLPDDEEAQQREGSGSEGEEGRAKGAGG